MKNIFLPLLLLLSINSHSQRIVKDTTFITGTGITLSQEDKFRLLDFTEVDKKIYVSAIQYVHRNYIMIDDKVKFIQKKKGKWYTDKGNLVKVVWYKLRYGSTDEWIDASFLDY